MAKRKTRVKASGKKSSKKSPAKSRFGTLAKCAAALHLGERRVQQLVREGLPKAARGRYDVDKCLRFYVRYLQKKLQAAAVEDPDGGYTADREVRHRLLSMDAEMKQIELAKERRQFVSIDRVTKDLASIVLEIKQRILQIPPRLAAELIGERDLVVITDKIDRSLKDALVQLSTFNPDNVRR
jgi:phage terminase Nu1 subunit (DNA packaging protein)